MGGKVEHAGQSGDVIENGAELVNVLLNISDAIAAGVLEGLEGIVLGKLKVLAEALDECAGVLDDFAVGLGQSLVLGGRLHENREGRLLEVGGLGDLNVVVLDLNVALVDVEVLAALHETSAPALRDDFNVLFLFLVDLGGSGLVLNVQCDDRSQC